MAWTTPGTATAGSVLTAAYWNVNVRDNTNALYQTVQRLGYTQRTTNYSVASTTAAGAANIFSSSITFTADGTSAYLVEFYCALAESGTTAASQVYARLVDGSGTDLGLMAVSPKADGTRSGSTTWLARTYYTPSAGSVTLNVRGTYFTASGTLSAGSGGAGAYFPMYLAVFGPPLA